MSRNLLFSQVGKIKEQRCIAFRCTAGTFDFSYNEPNHLWVFPDGSTSTDDRPTRTLASGGTVLLYAKFPSVGLYVLRANTSINLISPLSQFAKRLYYINLTKNTNITGDLSDLKQKIFSTINLTNCSLVTGNIASISSGITTGNVSLWSCTNVIGDLATLNGKITGYLYIPFTNIYGIYTPISGQAYPLNNINISNCKMTPSDTDATLIAINNNCISVSGKTLDICANKTAVSLTAYNSLISKGLIITQSGAGG